MCKNCDVIKGALYLKNKSLIGITKILQSYLHKCMLLMFYNHLNNLQRKLIELTQTVNTHNKSY